MLQSEKHNISFIQNHSNFAFEPQSFCSIVGAFVLFCDTSRGCSESQYRQEVRQLMIRTCRHHNHQLQ